MYKKRLSLRVDVAVQGYTRSWLAVLARLSPIDGDLGCSENSPYCVAFTRELKGMTLHDPEYL
jgi:hypothetical protein